MPKKKSRVPSKLHRNRMTRARRVLKRKDAVQQAMSAFNKIEADAHKEEQRQALLRLTSINIELSP